MDQIDYIRENIIESTKFIRSRAKIDPEIGLILGSGMSDSAPTLDEEIALPYEDIPHFPTARVAGHRGELALGKINEKKVAIMKGRFHYYEGYTMKGATFPVLVLAQLGVKFLIVTNAAGGLRRHLAPGDFVLVEDHINLMGDNPLIGPNDESIGTRFVDMSQAYDEEMIVVAEKAAKESGVKARKGVLAAVSGPSYETKAEVRFLSIIGADAVTMSTVPEVIMANYAGIRTIAISLISNAAQQTSMLTHEEVLEEAKRSSKGLREWLTGIIKKL